MTSKSPIIATNRHDQLRAFSEYLQSKNYLPTNTSQSNAATGAADTKLTLRQMWESTELSANDFAEEVAAFYGLPRLTLPQLVAAKSLAVGL